MGKEIRFRLDGGKSAPGNELHGLDQFQGSEGRDCLRAQLNKECKLEVHSVRMGLKRIKSESETPFNSVLRCERIFTKRSLCKL